MKRYLKHVIVGVFIILFTCRPMIALAVDSPGGFDTGFYNSNDIIFYDERATPCTTTMSFTSSGPGTTSADQKKNAEAILRNLTGKGLTLAQATGFVGNMQAESSLNPAIIQGGATAPDNYTPVNGVGFGLVQWTFTSRQQPLVNMARDTNRKITDINLQMDYVWKEVTSSYKSTIQALTSIPSITPTEAAIIVHGKTPATKNDPRFVHAPNLGYEASADSANGVVTNRGGAAEGYYKMFKGIIPDGTGVSGLGTADAPQVSIAGASCGGSIATPTGDCPVTKPTYGEFGNGHQLGSDELIATYGKGGDAARPNLVKMDFLGKPVEVHKLVAPCLQAVINDIKKANVNYTVKVIGGWRTAAGAGLSDPRKSYHYYGAAIDINPDQNPFSGTGFPMPFDMPKEYVDIFHAHGWSWGGNWHSVKDYMHFEFNGIGPGKATP